MTNLMELEADGALKTTTKKANGVNVRVMKVNLEVWCWNMMMMTKIYDCE